MVIDGAINTRFTSAARPAVAADVGNGVNVTSGTGFTVQRVEIVSVSAGAYNVDKSLGTLGSTGGNGRLGGAVQTLATALSAMAASNTIYLKGTGHTAAAAITGGAGGTGAAPGKILGYGTTRGDNTQAVITATASFTTLLQPSGDRWIIRNLKLDCADTVQEGFRPNSTGITIYMENCWSTRWTRRGLYTNSSNDCVMVNCLASNGTGGSNLLGQSVGGFVGAGNCFFHRCTAKDSASVAFTSDNGSAAFVNCAAYNMNQESAAGGHGAYVFGATGIRLINCTFADLEGSGVLNPNAGTSAFDDFIVENCIFSNVSRYAFESSTVVLTDSQLATKFRNNAFFSITLGRQLNVVVGTGEITLTANPFVDMAGGDLDLNNTSGGGAACRSAGVPGTLLGLSSTSGAMDIGALQATVASNDATSGGLTTMVDLWREWTSEFNTTRIPNSVVHKYLQSGLEAFNDITGFAYTDDSSTTLVNGTQEYSIPSDLIEAVWVEHNGQRLTKADLEEMERNGEEWRNLPANTPTKWAIYGNKLVVVPKPNAAAVAAASTITIRYIRSPRDIGVFGPEGLAAAHYRTVVRWGVYEYSSAHPDSATAETRRANFLDMFNRAAAAAAEFYLRRRLERTAASELQTASGTRRTRG